MSKRILVTSTDLMMVQFLLPHIQNLAENGYEVEIACSEVGGRMDEIRTKLKEHVQAIHTVRLHRSPANLDNLNGYRDMKKIISDGHYDLIWTNEPVMGVVTRLAARVARKQGTKVLYMTHGYHFFKGCPAKLKIFYPIEKFTSQFCDCIVTISYEDFELSKAKFHADKVYHINGIGLDTEKFGQICDVSKKREELGIPQNAFVVMSVGELKPHKNHKVIIDAIGQLKNSDVHYIICGKGELLPVLQDRAEKLGIKDQVHFLGYRKDVYQLLGCADVFAFPSVREGLGLASLEAMAAGLPILGSDTRGIRDYVINGKTGYLCRAENPADFADGLQKLYEENLRLTMSEQCRQEVKKYDICCIKKSIENILEALG